MPLTLEELKQIQHEVLSGLPNSVTSEEGVAARARMEKEAAAAKAAGTFLRFPAEMADIDEPAGEAP